MEENTVNLESIKLALSEINSESAKILENGKETQSLDEEALSIFSRHLIIFNEQVVEFLFKFAPRDIINSSQSSFLQSLNCNKFEEKGTQLDNTDYYDPRFNRNESLGRLLCSAMIHFSRDLTNF